MKTVCLTSSAAAVAMASLFVCSCSDEKNDQNSTSDAQPSATAPVQQPAVVPPAAEEIKGLLPQEIVACPWLEVQGVEVAEITRQEGVDHAPFTLTLRLKEDLCEPAEPPAQLDKLRMKVNPLLNRAMTPESQYLLQIGADPETISAEDQKAKPLPAELKKNADALKQLAESPVFKAAVLAGETLVLQGSASRDSRAGAAPAPESSQSATSTPTAEAAADSESAPPVESEKSAVWALVSLDEQPLDAWRKWIPQSALPEGGALLSASWLMERTQQLETAIAAFEQAVTPYIDGREDAARTRLLEEQAREDAETAKASAAAEALRKERALFEQASAAGKTWQGEWALGEQGGKLAMTIVTSEAGDRSAMLTANLSDPDLPQASIDMKGRCLLIPEEGENYRFQIAIIDGLYDPDAATAKIYDASDGVVLLNLTDEGSLEGVMTCKSWTEEQKKQDIKVLLKPSVKSSKSRK